MKYSGNVCQHCRFFETDNTDDGFEDGACHRYAPRPVIWKKGDEDLSSIGKKMLWPMVSACDYCGDFQKEEPSP